METMSEMHLAIIIIVGTCCLIGTVLSACYISSLVCTTALQGFLHASFTYEKTELWADEIICPGS